MFSLPDLLEVAAEYAAVHDLDDKHKHNFCTRAQWLATHVGCRSVAACCDAHALNSFLAMYGADHAPSTLKGVRGDLLTLWRYAAHCGYCDPPDPEKILRRRVPAGSPDCYSVEEVRQLLLDCEHVRHGSYWDAAIRVGWDTGLRRSDVLRVRFDQVRPRKDGGGVLATVAKKTGLRVVHQLDAATVAAIKRVKSLAWHGHEWQFCAEFQELRDITVGRGTFKWLRRSSGSYVAADFGEAVGAQHLGHTNLATFRKFYDARLVAESRPTPPRL